MICEYRSKCKHTEDCTHSENHKYNLFCSDDCAWSDNNTCVDNGNDGTDAEITEAD